MGHVPALEAGEDKRIKVEERAGFLERSAGCSWGECDLAERI